MKKYNTKKIFSLLTVISLLFIGCGQRDSLEDAFVLKPGDLLLQDLDCGPFCDAIEKVTRGYQGTNLSHVGVVALYNNNVVVIEALLSGVKVTPLEIFLRRNIDTEHRPKVLVGRLKGDYQHLISSALTEAFALEGKPYDKVFDINNDAYYCSELIYKIFLRANNGQPLFTLQPMTFKDPDTGNILPVWEDYFLELGVPIPEGKPGINPGGISRSTVLVVIRAYGTPSGWVKGES